MNAPYYDDSTVTVLHGDCLDILREMPDSSVDAVVTDPPAGISFMSKSWDTDHGGRDQFVEWLTVRLAECARIMKPGAHAFVWAMPRTSGWTQRAIEDAGLIPRECVIHLFGSGFPKSLDVSKAIDKVNGESGRLHKFTAWMRTTGLTSRQLDEATGTNMGGHYLTAASQPAIPTPDLWAHIRPLAASVPGWVDELVDRIEAEREITQAATRDAVMGKTISFDQRSSTERERRDIPATPEAQQWAGWGTALKPASEHWWLARKPLGESTVAANVLAYGTGALNIDATRIGTEVTGQRPTMETWENGRYLCSSCAEDADKTARPAAHPRRAFTAPRLAELSTNGRGETPPTDTFTKATGCSDGTTGAVSESSSSSIGPSGKGTTALSPMGTSFTTSITSPSTIDLRTCNSCGVKITSDTTSESPSYTPTGRELRPSTTASGSGGRWPSNVILDEFTAEAVDQQSGNRKGSGVYDGDGSRRSGEPWATDLPGGHRPQNMYDDQGGASRYFYTAKADSAERITHKRTAHPTVKPLSLMRYLVRLVTPPGGTCLDPFAGSGTTVEACILEGFCCIAIE